MSNMTDTTARGNDRYLLEDEERWESLGFDVESWNATVKKILRKQTLAASNEPRRTVRSSSPVRSFTRSNWMA